MPGTDPVEAMRLIFDELPDLPHLVELPDRGPGADMIGRSAALLVDLAVDVTTGGWRFADRPGRAARRARSLLARDLDALEEVADGYRGTLKVQVCGPWTMAAAIELARSHEPSLADRGAVSDLVASLAEGVTAHVADVRMRVPGATVVLQLDEPALPSVLAGGVPSASGLNRVRAIEEQDAESALREVLAAGQVPGIVHCCAMSVPLGMIRGAGAAGVGIDLGQLRRGEEELLAEAVEAGLGIFVGAVPATPSPGTAGARGNSGSAAARGPGTTSNGPPGSGPTGRRGASGEGPGRAGSGRTGSAEGNRAGQPPSPHDTAIRVRELWRQMGWPVARQPGVATDRAAGIAAQVVITPGCGLAGAPPDYAQAALGLCRQAAQLLPELIEEEAP
jgi:hypothetical protein